MKVGREGFKEINEVFSITSVKTKITCRSWPLLHRHEHISVQCSAC